MNDRQAEELLALEAIFPDTVSWSHLPDERGVEVRVTAPVVFEEALEVEIRDTFQEDILAREDPVKVDDAGADPTSDDGDEPHVERSTDGRTNGRGRTRRRQRGGKPGPAVAPADKVALAPTARCFEPRRSNGLAPLAGEMIALPDPVARRDTISAEDPAATEEKPRVRLVPTSRALDNRDPSAPEVDNAADPARAQTRDEAPRLSLRHFPTIRLTITLPPDYPEDAPPSSIRISDDDRWLGKERRRIAEANLAALYTGDECLLSILEYVSPSSWDFASTFSLQAPLILRAEPSPSDPPGFSLSEYLTSFDAAATSEHFVTTSHACPLCFTTQRGSSCVRIASCGCVFCIDCLKDYFSLLITEGLVRSVACPSRECVEKRATWEKEEATATARKGGERDEVKPGRVTAGEVEQLVGVEGRKRWEWLLEKARVESDPSITWCPRDACQAPVPKLSEDDEKLRVCPACDYSFCVFCRRGWHGTRNACALPQSSAIVSKYLEGDPEERRTLEVRYGTANIKRLVAAYEEERALQEWLQKHSTACPGCSAWVEKSQGCNHMTCAKCRTHFCYRCGKSISPLDPYKHFATPGMSCYGKLFDFMPGQEPQPDEWINFLGEDAY